FALALQADGKVLAGGDQGLFRLNPDGSPDGSCVPYVPYGGVVTRIVVLPDGKLLVNSGDRFNQDGSADSTVGSQRIHFNWGGCFVDSGADEVLAVQADGKVWASGVIEPYCNNYSTRSQALLRLNPDGSLDSSSQPAAIADDSIGVLAIEANGNVLIGGSFRSVNGVSRDGLARLFANHDTHSGVAYAATDCQVGEDGQNATITVQRLGNSQGAFTVDYTTANGTAQAGADFAAQSGTLQFAPLETSKTIIIPIYDHLSVSPDKQFQVVLSHPSDGVVLNAGPSTEAVTIHDAERPGSVDFRFHPQIPFLGGAARTAVQRDGKVLVSGLFTHPISGFRTSVLRLNTDGTIDNAFELRVTPYTYLGAQDSPVLAIAQQTDDKIVIGGAFRNPFQGFDSEIASPLIQSSVDVESPNGIARVNTDGTLDESFNPGTGVSGGAVRALAIQPNGKILIGGDFSTVNGFSRRGIARLNAAGELDPDFNVESSLAAGGINVTVLLLQADGKVLLGGSFAEVEGKVRTLARLNPDSSLDGTFDPGLGAAIYRTPSLLPRITSLAMQTDGKILVAGAFDRFNGEPRPSVTRLNADGSVDKSFSPHLQLSEQTYYSNPLSVAIQADGRILVAGIYLSSGNNSIDRPGIARLNPDGTLDKSFDPGADTATGADCCVSSLVLEPDGKVLLGGTFTTF
ncbi:MAG: Calx-beta domain-containing protein, partial [Verrucomicrobiota bacterium]